MILKKFYDILSVFKQKNRTLNKRVVIHLTASLKTYSHRNPTSSPGRSHRSWRTTAVHPPVRQWYSQSTPSSGRGRGRCRAPHRLYLHSPRELDTNYETILLVSCSFCYGWNAKCKCPSLSCMVCSIRNFKRLANLLQTIFSRCDASQQNVSSWWTRASANHPALRLVSYLDLLWASAFLKTLNKRPELPLEHG